MFFAKLYFDKALHAQYLILPVFLVNYPRSACSSFRELHEFISKYFIVKLNCSNKWDSKCILLTINAFTKAKVSSLKMQMKRMSYRCFLLLHLLLFLMQTSAHNCWNQQTLQNNDFFFKSYNLKNSEKNSEKKKTEMLTTNIFFLAILSLYLIIMAFRFWHRITIFLQSHNSCFYSIIQFIFHYLETKKSEL